MNRETRPVRRKPGRHGVLPAYVKHRSFNRPSAAESFDPKSLIAADVSYAEKYMPDDVTKQHAKLMHYAAHRMHEAVKGTELRRWENRYISLRDRIVLGNRKLIYRAVKRRMAMSNRTEDLIGDCHIVLIHAVAAFNPWIGIRFSTYAYTCLIRALGRSSQKSGHDLLSHSFPLDSFPNMEPAGHFEWEPASNGLYAIDRYLREDHPLLTDREKAILSRRFRFVEIAGTPTLETVGRTMGLSKERVRQVQTTALEKLRLALTAPELA